MIRSITNLLFLAIVLAVPSGVAFARGSDFDLQLLLRGNYRFIAEQSCIESEFGFYPYPSLEPMGPSSTYTSSIAGRIRFDGQGNAVQTSRFNTHYDNSPAQPVGVGSVNCNYTYTVNPDRTLAMEGSCTGHLSTGPGAGLDFVVSGLRFEGFVGLFRETLIMAAIEPIEDDLTLSDSSGVVFHAKRLCRETRTYLRDRH